MGLFSHIHFLLSLFRQSRPFELICSPNSSRLFEAISLSKYVTRTAASVNSLVNSAAKQKSPRCCIIHFNVNHSIIVVTMLSRASVSSHMHRSPNEAVPMLWGNWFILFQIRKFQDYARFIQGVIAKKEELGPMTKEIYTAIKHLWADKSVQVAFTRKDEYYLNDSAR